ncbi:iron-containing alcohol dehydrogenase [Vibrio parahaemolyticus]|uniref:iron-containing alcohol dehydrogenase n=1 Tax=Vibrio parahaemolyticus TaxID=670 RepID=UPI00084B0B0E|nr:iron-containing alcohol dehydrogenase [Vibrio parahaemolyticus]EGR0228003.1 iron-containing alcohol dehydrogenase [Vibrio parahaemolyticus]EGR1362365.1 iron-containing alcohol dehydrogenase [Vibrio parahaemolyticus]EGR9058936.1 iron-containing alcohol dehydrogenase [Vibrio parahaemolyticus]EGU1086083.1 iron-containing alcohol dehydrogenase [Vibrio parahaemolyticus]EHD7139644.1 iron-containing alcohol dehydrogenase [Vibrio parahaemolyticus]
MLKHCLYRSYTKGLKIAAHVLPLPRPTLFSGSGAVSELLEAISDLGFRRLLLVTDEGLVRIGMVGKVLEQTQGLGLQVGVFSEVKPDPTYDQVEDGLRAYNASQSEAILALGGGSAIDCAKVIAARVSNKRSIKKLSGLFKVWRTPAPLFVIPTTSGTGSEVTIAAVVSDPNTHLKTPLMDPKLVPIMAALDPNLLIGLPAKITADTGIDALTHAVEAYISRNATPETQAYSVAAIKLIFHYLPKAMAQGGDIEARYKMAMASYYAGLAFTKASLGYVHAFAHNLGARYGLPHGMANGLALLPVLKFSLPEIEDELRTLAEKTNINTKDKPSAERFLEQIESLYDAIGIEKCTTVIKQDDIEDLVYLILKEAHWNYPVPKFMNSEECARLLIEISA